MRPAVALIDERDAQHSHHADQLPRRGWFGGLGRCPTSQGVSEYLLQEQLVRRGVSVLGDWQTLRASGRQKVYPQTNPDCAAGLKAAVTLGDPTAIDVVAPMLEDAKENAVDATAIAAENHFAAAARAEVLVLEPAELVKFGTIAVAVLDLAELAIVSVVQLQLRLVDFVVETVLLQLGAFAHPTSVVEQYKQKREKQRGWDRLRNPTDRRHQVAVLGVGEQSTVRCGLLSERSLRRRRVALSQLLLGYVATIVVLIQACRGGVMQWMKHFDCVFALILLRVIVECAWMLRRQVPNWQCVAMIVLFVWFYHPPL